MELLKAFSIDPGVGDIDVVGSAGYTFPSAIADLIDNCISAHAKHIIVYIDYLSKEHFIYIQDDGDGMNYDNLHKAAVIGQKGIDEIRNEDDLGRFSTGLKSATKSFCANIVVASKTKDSSVNSIDIDYDKIKELKRWIAFDVKGFEFENLLADHGTVVYCDRLSIFKDNYSDEAIYNELDSLERSLSHIFGKFILNEQIQILIETPNNLANPLPVQGWNPFGLPESKNIKKIYSENHPYKNGFIGINAYIMPVFEKLSKIDQDYMSGNGLLNQEGFYIYRNHRLICEGGWLNVPGMKLDDKCKYGRIEVEIPTLFDQEFGLNFSKNAIQVPPELLDLFLKVAKKTREESHRSLNYMRHPGLKPKIKEKEEKVWRVVTNEQGSHLVINQNHPLVIQLCDSMSQKQRNKLFALLEKSIPVTMLQTQETTTDDYSKEEIKSFINDVYQKLAKEGKSLEEIKKYMKNVEPFRSHIDDLCDFFGALEEEK